MREDFQYDFLGYSLGTWVDVSTNLKESSNFTFEHSLILWWKPAGNGNGLGSCGC